MSSASYPLLGEAYSITRVVEHVARCRTEQRDTHCMPLSSYFFPGQKLFRAKDIFCPDSCRVAPTWICKGVCGCKLGDCSYALDALDVSIIRHKAMSRTAALVTGPSAEDITLASLFEMDIHTLLQRSTATEDTWSRINVHVDKDKTVCLCVSAYGAALGVTGASIYNAVSNVKSGTAQSWAIRSKTLSKASEYRSVTWKGASGRSHEVMDRQFTAEYVCSLIDKHEMAPAPGAASRHIETHVTKQSWKRRFANMEDYFHGKGLPCPGSKSMLKREWKKCLSLKDKQQCSHSKCDICSGIDKKLLDLKGKTDALSMKHRGYLLRAYKDHETMHLAARKVLDDAGLRARENPREIWTIICDAATSRNFALPRFSFRRPKCFGTKPFYQFKFLCTYAYGFGFQPFLLHDSVSDGSNATCSVLWETLQRLFDHYGYWPDVIHFQLDNCSGDNKNEFVRGFCAWLVDSGKVRQVRIFFLDVGHTHIIIDQIFGVITVGLRRDELLTVGELITNIDVTLHENLAYQAANCVQLFGIHNWVSFVKDECKIHKFTHANQLQKQDEQGQYKGLHDFIITKQPTGFALMQYREQWNFSLLPANCHGCSVLTHKPTSMVQLCEPKSRYTWGWKNKCDVMSTVSLVLAHSRRAVSSASKDVVQQSWRTFEALIPSIASMLKVELIPSLRHFNSVATSDLLRITCQGQPEAGGQSDDLEFQRYLQENNIGFRRAPFAIDPCVSSEQTEKELADALMAMAVDKLEFAEAVTDITKPVLTGYHCLAYLDAERKGLSVVKIESFGPMQGPRSIHLDIKATILIHTQAESTPGLFGSFLEDTGPKAKITLGRSNLLVLNCILMVSCLKERVPKGSKKKKVLSYLSLESLRVLSRLLPNDYAMPAAKDIPATHLSTLPAQGQHGRQPSNKPANSSASSRKKAKPSRRVRRLATSSDDESSSASGDQDGDEESSEKATAKRGLPARNNKKKNSYNEDNVSSDSSNEENDSSQLSSDESDAGSIQSSAVPNPEALLLPGPNEVFDHKADTIVFCNMDSEEGWRTKDTGHQRYAVCLAYVESITVDQQLQIRWFTPNTSSKWPGKVSFVRNFTKDGIKTMQTIRGRRKKDLKVTSEHIKEFWSQDTWEPKHCLPLVYPDQLYDASTLFCLQDKHDAFKISEAWIVSELIPACEAANLVRNK